MLSFLFAFFLAGDATARHWDLIGRIVERPVVVLGCAVVAVPVLVAGAVGHDVRYAVVWVPCVVAAIVASKGPCELLADSRAGSVLSTVGQQSLVYYVCHFVVIGATAELLDQLGFASPYGVFVILMTAALVASWVLVRLRGYTAIDALFAWPSSGSRDPRRWEEGRSPA
jgi:peptidoglycan/LPS O-acetylase OafA/YrhL